MSGWSTVACLDEINKLSCRIKTLEECCEDVKNQIKELEQQITNQQEQIDELKNQIINIENQINELEQSINNINSEISNINNDITNIENQITQINNTITNIQNQINNIQNSINILNEKNLIFFAAMSNGVIPDQSIQYTFHNNDLFTFNVSFQNISQDIADITQNSIIMKKQGFYLMTFSASFVPVAFNSYPVLKLLVNDVEVASPQIIYSQTELFNSYYVWAINSPQPNSTFKIRLKIPDGESLVTAKVFNSILINVRYINTGVFKPPTV